MISDQKHICEKGAKFGKTDDTPAMCIFTRTISSYFRPPITQKLLDLHTWNVARLIRPTGTPRTPNFMHKSIIDRELLRSEKCAIFNTDSHIKNLELLLILEF